MASELVPIVLFLSIAFVTVNLARIVAEGVTRWHLVRNGASPEAIRGLLSTPQVDDRGSALKWGLVAAGVGLALIVVQFLPYEATEPIAYGLILLFAGGALLTYSMLIWRRA